MLSIELLFNKAPFISADSLSDLYANLVLPQDRLFTEEISDFINTEAQSFLTKEQCEKLTRKIKSKTEPCLETLWEHLDSSEQKHLNLSKVLGLVVEKWKEKYPEDYELYELLIGYFSLQGNIVDDSHIAKSLVKADILCNVQKHCLRKAPSSPWHAEVKKHLEQHFQKIENKENQVKLKLSFEEVQVKFDAEINSQSEYIEYTKCVLNYLQESFRSLIENILAKDSVFACWEEDKAAIELSRIVEKNKIEMDWTFLSAPLKTAIFITPCAEINFKEKQVKAPKDEVTTIKYIGGKAEQKNTIIFSPMGNNKKMTITELDNEIIKQKKLGKSIYKTWLLTQAKIYENDKNADYHQLLCLFAAYQIKKTGNTDLKNRVNEVLKKIDNPLCFFLKEKRNQIVKHLLSEAMFVEQINFVDDDGLAPLDIAIENNDIEMCKLFRKCGSDIVASDIDGLLACTTLQRAVKQGHIEIVDWILSENDVDDAFINRVTGNAKLSALHYAVLGGHKEIAKRLIDAGGSFKLRNRQGYYPIEFIDKTDCIDRRKTDDFCSYLYDLDPELIEAGRLDSLLVNILKKGLYSSAKKISKNMTLSKNSIKFIETIFLKLRKYQLSADDAMVNAYTELATRFVKKGFSCNDYFISEKTTALHIAASGQFNSIIKLLTNKGVKQCADENNNYPLHIALMSDNVNVETVQLLLESAESSKMISAANNDRKTPAALAAEQGYQNMLEKIKDRLQSFSTENASKDELAGDIDSNRMGNVYSLLSDDEDDPMPEDILEKGLGSSDFNQVVNGPSYVDKTLILQHFLNDENGMIVLLTRPRRFGKSLTVSMLSQFLTRQKIKEREKSAEVFKKLKIGTYHPELIARHHGKHTVIRMNFSKMERISNAKDAVTVFGSMMAKVYAGFNPVLELIGKENEIKKNYIHKILNKQGDSDDVINSLHYLTEYLYDYYEKKHGPNDARTWIYILIDEYDIPFKNCFDDEKAKGFITQLLRGALKDNSKLKRAFLFGVSKIAQESLFSAFNNPVCYSLLNDSRYAEDFGFNDQEVDELLKKWHVLNKVTPGLEQMKKWYGGYTVRTGAKRYNEALLNPWSVLNQLNAETKQCSSYWAENSTATIISDLIKNWKEKSLVSPIDNEYIQSNFYRKIARTFIKLFRQRNYREKYPEQNVRRVYVQLDEHLVFKDLFTSRKAFWTLLHTAGYISVNGERRRKSKSETIIHEHSIIIPNEEVYLFINKKYDEWFPSFINKHTHKKIRKQLDSANEKDILEGLEKLKYIQDISQYGEYILKLFKNCSGIVKDVARKLIPEAHIFDAQQNFLQEAGCHVKREESLKKIKEEMEAFTWRKKIGVLYGISGAGKTELAKDYIKMFLGSQAEKAPINKSVFKPALSFLCSVADNFFENCQRLAKKINEHLPDLEEEIKLNQSEGDLIAEIWLKLNKHPGWLFSF